MLKRILVVDDELAIRRSFELALSHLQFELVTVESGMKALSEIERKPFDLIYLDLNMPDMNGVQTLTQLRKISPEVPVYIITGFHRDFFDNLIQLRQEGIAFELLRKPIGRQQISDITCGILGETVSLND